MLCLSPVTSIFDEVFIGLCPQTTERDSREEIVLMQVYFETVSVSFNLFEKIMSCRLH